MYEGEVTQSFSNKRPPKPLFPSPYTVAGATSTPGHKLNGEVT